jgi:hypothetical protein
LLRRLNGVREKRVFHLEELIEAWQMHNGSGSWQKVKIPGIDLRMFIAKAACMQAFGWWNGTDMQMFECLFV